MLLSPAQAQALTSFLCNHFDAAELTHLARGIFAEQQSLIHTLPPLGTPLAVLADAFVNVAQRHGYTNDELCQALCAARPRLRDTILKIWDGFPVVDTSPVAVVKHHRLRLSLELDFDSVTEHSVAEILSLLKAISGDARILIESISKGSAIFVLRGGRNSLVSLARHFWTHPQEKIDGFRVLQVELVPREKLRSTERRRARVVDTELAVGDHHFNLQPDVTDSELLTRWRAGDNSAGSKLFRDHVGAITAFFRRNIHDRAEVEDLIQETFLALRVGTTHPEKVSHYLHRIAFFKFARHLRRSRGLRESESDPSDYLGQVAGELTPDPEYVMIQREDTRLLMRAIRRLELTHQQVLELSFWGQMKNSEIAAVLDIPVRTAARRLRLAREKLKGKLAELADSQETLRTTSMRVSEWCDQIDMNSELIQPTKVKE